MAKWGFEDIPDQSGRTAVVTGANSGLGLVTARELARAGARVIFTARDEDKAESARSTIAEAAPDAELEPRTLDLADLGSVRSFAEGVDRLDLLVNNAGVMMTPRQETADGFELQLGTNHLGHFALTGLLLDKLGGDDPRVVTVTSIEHRPGKLDFDDLQMERDYEPRRSYQRSKLANAVFGLELARRLKAAGSPVKSLLAHPGYTATNLQLSGPTGAMQTILRFGNKLFAQDVEPGTLPQLYAATAADVENGAFYGPDGFRELRGSPTRVETAGRAKKEDTGRKLWDASQELTRVSYL